MYAAKPWSLGTATQTYYKYQEVTLFATRSFEFFRLSISLVLFCSFHAHPVVGLPHVDVFT